MINNPPKIHTPTFENCTPGENELNPNIAEIIIKANSDRKYAVIVNHSSVEFSIVLGGVKKADKPVIVLKPGGSYEINSNNLYIGDVSAISKFACKVHFMECVE
jgi:hypothetical protein